MDTITYILFSQLGIALLYLIYKLCLSGDTFLCAHRITLLCGVIFAYLYPFAYLQGLHTHINDIYERYSRELPTIEVSADMMSSSINIVDIYLGGVLLGLLLFLVRLLSILYLRIRSTGVCVEGVKVYNPNIDIMPFSFGTAIFINIERYEESMLHNILLHEKAHVSRLHIIDLILSELVVVFGWFNPLSWLLRREMRLVLEFLADANAVKHTPSAKDYQYHLLKAVQQKALLYQWGAYFNHTMLSRRIRKLNQRDSHFARKCCYLALLPASLFLLCMANVWPRIAEQPLMEIINNKSIEQDISSNSRELGETTMSSDKTLPQFPGGDIELYQYIANNIKYPSVATQEKVEGRVIVQFIIDSEGRVVSPKILRGLTPECDAEVLRVVGLMPRWKPAEQDGVAVECDFVLPVIFKINES